jgi:[CysO sulfur-carrier protein]-S-L-cysteine hydrolase
LKNKIIDMLTISQHIIDQLFEHAKNGLPEEVCGYLAGTDRVVTNHFRMTNIDHSSEHFAFDPAEQFQVVRQVRKEGKVILANYHSHPETPARPSQEDIRLAYDPEISYVIVSLASETPDIKSFIIRNGIVEKEEIQIVGT